MPPVLLYQVLLLLGGKKPVKGSAVYWSGLCTILSWNNISKGKMSCITSKRTADPGLLQLCCNCTYYYRHYHNKCKIKIENIDTKTTTCKNSTNVLAHAICIPFSNLLSLISNKLISHHINFSEYKQPRSGGNYI